MEENSEERVRHLLHRFMTRNNRLAAWLGRVVNGMHEYYLRLEDKIDHVERVLKSMSVTDRLIVHHSSRLNAQVRGKFENLLRRQRNKHVVWFSVDLVVSGVVVLLTPVLAPLPGPNIFFYYPFLRLLSHYRAILGTLTGLRSRRVEFKSLPDLSGLADNLQGFRTFIRRVS
jgi:hypothetical protein